MVVFHSPKQRRGPSTYSCSPAPNEAFDDDVDDIFKATPGPARGRSADYAVANGRNSATSSSHVKQSGSNKSRGATGLNGSAILKQRMQQSLMMVADSPSSKLNAPDPFKPKKQLHRSPPPASMVLDHSKDGEDADKQQEQQAVTEDLPAQESLQHQGHVIDTGTAPLLPSLPSIRELVTNISVKGKEREHKSYDVAAKALFDNKPMPFATGSTLGATNARLSLPALPTPSFSTPQASTSRHKAPSPLPHPHFSAPMLASTSMTSISSAPKNATASTRSLSQETPLPSLAKMQRMKARANDLEDKLRSRTEDYNNLVEEYDRLQTQYESLTETQRTLQEKQLEYDMVAEQCADLIDRYEETVSQNQSLKERVDACSVEAEDAKYLAAKAKWKERKLRNDVNIRREESNYREIQLNSNQLNSALREATLEIARLASKNIVLQEELSRTKYEKRKHGRASQVAKEAVEEKVRRIEVLETALRQLQTTFRENDGKLRRANDAQDRLAKLLDDEKESRQRSELRCLELEKRLDTYYTKDEDQQEALQSLKHKEATLKRLEKETMRLKETSARAEELAEEKEEELHKIASQLNDLQKEHRTLESKLRATEAERDQLKSTWDMHQRASRVFGDTPNHTSAESAVGSNLPALVDRDSLSRNASAGGSRSRNKLIRNDETEDTDDTDQPTLSKSRAGRNTSHRASSKKPILDSKALPSRTTDTDKKPKGAHKDENSLVKLNKQTKKGSSQVKSKREIPSSDSEEHENATNPRKRRRTAIKSGKPSAARKLLKHEESEGQSSSEDSEESDVVHVISSPKQSQKSSKTDNGRANHQASQSNKSSKVQKKRAPSVDVKLEDQKPDTASTVGKRKIALHKSVAAPFIWGAGNVGESTTRALIGLPDILSPVVKH